MRRKIIEKRKEDEERLKQQKDREVRRRVVCALWVGAQDAAVAPGCPPGGASDSYHLATSISGALFERPPLGDGTAS